MNRVFGALSALALMMAVGCGEAGEIDIQDEPAEQTNDVAESGIDADGLSVQQLIFRTCTTASVKGLSQQLIEEVECISPNTMKKIPDSPNLQLGGAVFPYLQTGAADALSGALDDRGSQMFITSGLRTLPQQFLLYQWYRNGRRCGIRLAARPGTSNHESGLAVDMTTYNTWRSTMSNNSFRWFGGSDPVHFDYTGPKKDIRSLSVRAFQRLWNRNHPEDQISEDGVYGNQTANRLLRAPATGFKKGASCGNPLQPATELTPMEVYWFRKSDGEYNLRTLAPSNIVRVTYEVDGFKIGDSTRAQGSNFPDAYTFSSPGEARQFVVRGFDSSDNEIGLGVGLIDVTEEVGVYIRQLGDKLYAVGLERAPSGVDHITVDVDGFDIGDSKDNSRPEVRYKFNQLGERQFTITTFNADGTVRGALRRTFKLQ